MLQVIKRIQETALAELREAAQQMDLKTCERIQDIPLPLTHQSDGLATPLRNYAKIQNLPCLTASDFEGSGPSFVTSHTWLLWCVVRVIGACLSGAAL